MGNTLAKREPFFTRDKEFYKKLFHLLIVVALQNLVAYSVNMADNMMLGNYSQTALSGAATVNQIFFMVQQFALAFGDGVIILGSQYWGQGRKEPVRTITGIAIKGGLISGIAIVIVCGLFSEEILGIFTTDKDIIMQGAAYLDIIKWTFILFILTQVMMSALRCVGTVNISFGISVVSLIINVGINYCLIFGYMGCPEMGIKGAAIGTLIARIVELIIVIVYMAVKDKKLEIFKGSFLKSDKVLFHDYFKVFIPVALSQILWSISVPMQTAILGHLSADAIAANSVATTFYQYLKVVVIAMSSASSVMIGMTIGKGDMKRIKSDARTMEVIDITIGIILAAVLFILREPLLSFYNMSDTAMDLSMELMAVMSVVMIGMSYQMPASFGIIRGGGDTNFTLVMNLISTWAIVMPLSFMSAFWWKWPVAWVVLVIQSDQIFKGIPSFIRMRSYKWVKNLTRPEGEQAS